MTPQERYGKDSFELSFELFPPKTAESEAMLWQTVDELMGFEPTLITCTYGAGGSTQTKTLEVLNGVHEDIHLSLLPAISPVLAAPLTN